MSDPTRPAPDPAQLPFEEALDSLERVVKQLEAGEVTLDQSVTQFEHGVSLIRRCRALLAAAEQRIALLTEEGEDGKLRLAPFEASQGPAPAAGGEGGASPETRRRK